jgi:hypothetical protein
MSWWQAALNLASEAGHCESVAHFLLQGTVNRTIVGDFSMAD